MRTKSYQWYRLRGYSQPEGGRTGDTVFIYLVESLSRHNVIKHYGGRRQFKFPNGTAITVHFPQHEHEIERMKEQWEPTPFELAGTPFISNGLVVKIFPATRYLCSCGKEHISEHPYPSMWCSCGQKAFPVPLVAFPPLV